MNILFAKKVKNNLEKFNFIGRKVSELNEKSYIKGKLTQHPSLIVSKYLVKFKSLDCEIHEFITDSYYNNYESFIKHNKGINLKNKTYPLESICWYDIEEVPNTTKNMYFFVGFMLAPISEIDVKQDEELMNKCKSRAKELGLL